MSCLYRHYDREGGLLYVGVSLNAAVRTSQHRSTAPWFGSVTRIEIEHFASRLEAEMAEREAVRAEDPLFNVVRFYEAYRPSTGRPRGRPKKVEGPVPAAERQRRSRAARKARGGG